ncbi:UBF1 factor, partial [Polypterus senegalus]
MEAGEVSVSLCGDWRFDAEGQPLLLLLLLLLLLQTWLTFKPALPEQESEPRTHLPDQLSLARLPFYPLPLLDAHPPHGRRENKAADAWSKEDLLHLLENMKLNIPPNDVSKFKTSESHLNWDKVAFNHHTGDVCRQKWLQISNKIRKFRTLTELIVDAEDQVQNPYKGKKLKQHPDFPKKPLTPYFRFFTEKRAKYAKLHPEMSSLDLTKILSKKYKELPEKKKDSGGLRVTYSGLRYPQMKYIEDFQREKEEYERSMDKFRKDHPDLMENLKRSDVPDKPKTPQQLWYNHEKKAYLKNYPDATTKEIKENLAKQWTQLSDKKRLKWINKSLEQQKQYEELMRVYVHQHPELNISQEVISKSTLTKAERQLKDKFAGRPTKPPPNCYSMYCAELMSNMKDVPSTERMMMCSKQWKLLSQKQKDVYQKRCEQSLPEKEQQRVLEEEKMQGYNKRVTSSPSSRSNSNAKGSSGKPKRPISAMFIFSEEKRKKLQEERPDLSENELTRLLARMWNELSDKKKEKYKRLEAVVKAESEKERSSLPESPKTAEEIWQQSVIGDYLARYRNDRAKALKAMEATWNTMEKKEKMMWIKKAAEDQKRYEVGSRPCRGSPPRASLEMPGSDVFVRALQRELSEMRAPPPSGKKMKFEGEPKKPPMNGYQKFSQELLSSGELNHLPLKERMVEIGGRWHKLTQAQKDRYKKIAEERQKQYKAIAHEIFNDLIDDACLGLCFDVHRAVKCGYFFLDETDPESMKDFEIVDQPGVDIFGQVYNQWKNKECVCPNCNRSIAASRFAPHLEKCLGMGRNSSRIANRRIASSNNMNKSESDQEDNDDINDNDWSYGSEKKGERWPEWHRCYAYNSGINYETLGPEELRSLLTTVSVPSRLTMVELAGGLAGWLAGRLASDPCLPLHSNAESSRTTARRCAHACPHLLSTLPSALPDAEGSGENDAYEPPEGQAPLSRLQWDGSSDISPSDSASSKASTNNSESKKTKKKKPHMGLGSAPQPGVPSSSSSKKKKPKPPAAPNPNIYDDIN